MKKQINNIRPRRGTKRALACSLEFIAQLKALFAEFGATDAIHLEGYEGMNNFLVSIPTHYGAMVIGVHNSDLDPEDVDGCLGVYGRFQDSTPDQMLRAHKILDSNPYSGKWNSYTNLDTASVESQLDYYRHCLTLVKPLATAEAAQ